MDPEILKARRFIQSKIYEILLKRNQQSPELSNKKMLDIVKRLEEGLFRSALSTDEYLNLSTLERRLHFLINRQPLSNDNQQFSRSNSSPSYTTMIPTPGLSQTSNLVNMNSSVDRSLVSSSNTTAVLSSNSTGNGPLSSGYQQSTSFSVNSGGANMVTSTGLQRMTSQMIPTPGYNNFSNSDVNSNASNQPIMKHEFSNVAGYPAVESAMVSQPMQQRSNVTNHNSHLLHDSGGLTGNGIRSNVQQRPYGLSNGSMNRGFGIIGNDRLAMNKLGASEGYLEYENSKPVQGHIDQRNLSMIQGDRYGAADASGTGNLYVPVTSVESLTNNENLNVLSKLPMTKTNSPRINNQQTVHLTQQVHAIALQSANQSGDVCRLSNYPVQEKVLQPYRHQQFQPPPNQVQSQMVQHQPQEQLQNQNQLLKNDVACHSSSNMIVEGRSDLHKDYHDEGRHSAVSESFQVSDVHNQFQQNLLDAHIRATQFIQTSGEMHQFSHPQNFVANTQNDVGGLYDCIKTDTTLSGGWFSNSQDVPHVTGRFQFSQNAKEDCHRLSGQDVAPPTIMPSDESVNASRSSEPPNSNEALHRSNYVNRDRQFKNQQRWLLFLRHARRCSAPEGKCQEPNCTMVQKLLTHMECCNEFECPFPRCHVTKGLITHHRRCRDTNCPVCVPVKNFIQSRLKAFCSDLGSGLHNSVNGSSKIHDSGEITGRPVLKADSSIVQTPENVQPTIKRMKIEHVSQSTIPLVSDIKESPLEHVQHHEQHDESHISVKSEISETKLECHGSILKISNNNIEMKNVCTNSVFTERLGGDNPSGIDVEVIKIEKKIELSKMENTLIPSENASKSGKPKIKGVSLIELFTPEQVRQHIRGLRQWVGQSKAKAEKNQAMEHLMSENSCQLCAVEKLNFEPPPIYCTPCGTRIKRNAMYYTFGTGDARHCFCISCYNETRGDTISADGSSLPKARMEKKKNDEETEEGWVQCDKCEAWQHQVCALFNGRRNDGDQAEYTCPNCYIIEVERGERNPLPQNAVLGAKDLPRTILSDHMEDRLFSRLKRERQERAKLQGKAYDEVPAAEALVVRVVSSVDKKLEVKPRFFEIFQEQNYPTEFPYKSKVILLFQNIEGVEVCLFGMYVQEFGSECKQPNHRRVYLSYLDSVKYFRPDVKAVTGEALRTFVYHEILIGYLDYCKKRGFTSCYIWACPPLKGEDYILYCHPEIQKTPKSDKLREWYLAMLKKAEKENIVAGLTNLCDHFFISTGESKAKVTAARLPYFDGDYWPGAAEDIIYQLQQEDSGGKLQKKGIMKKIITKRALKASGQTDLSGNISKDLLLMHKLGETISPMKEDFIMVHLQHACTHCCMLMVSANRWVCRQCKNFQLCDNCYDAEQEREDRERHPINHKDKHALYSVLITGVPDDTNDEDDILESEFFDTRQAFLSLCQVNHYQYDTLRRAKHSSMMVLYHLHNPTAPAFVTQCYVCHLDVEAGQGWRCEICPDYDVCNACYQKDKGINHPHRLTNNPSNDRDAQNTEARELRVTQLRKMLDLLVHASQCRSPQCQYPNCRKVKGLFRHGMMCKIRASGGCVLCKKMWYLLQLHARACKESDCHVPRCRDLKEHLRRMQQQSDSRRRAAVMEMMRQRAAEVS